MSMIFGVIYLVLGLSLSATIVSRLCVYWEGFLRPQKMLFLGIVVVMFGFTQRGIELLWFNAPEPRPAAYMGVVGASVMLVALLSPVDARLKPKPWQESLKQQAPADYGKVLAILAESQSNRKLDRNTESTVDNGFDKRHESM